MKKLKWFVASLFGFGYIVSVYGQGWGVPSSKSPKTATKSESGNSARGGWGNSGTPSKSSTKTKPVVRSQNAGWGTSRTAAGQPKLVIGSIDQPTSISNCSCVSPSLCLTTDTTNQGEGVIDPRHACAPGYVCCIHPLTTPVVNLTDQCGVRESALMTRITSTTKASEGEFPWMVAVLQETNSGNILFLCGGTLVHREVVLTAAHCVDDITTGSLIARVGEYDASTTDEAYPSVDITVVRKIVHPDYHASDLCNDIALLFLDDPADTSQPNIGLSCLPGVSENYVLDECVVTGWGKEAFDSTLYSAYLRKIQVPIVQFDSCQSQLQASKLGARFRLDPSFICAGKDGSDACTGDGGGPLMCPMGRDQNTLIQVGIVSWGLGCNSGVPGVYVDLVKFRNWVQDNIDNTVRIDPLR